jgi:hypothetical protein
VEPKQFPQAALETVSHDRVSHPSADAEAETRRPTGRPRDGEHHEIRAVALAAALLDIGIVPRRANAEILPESIPAVRRRTGVRSRHRFVTANALSVAPAYREPGRSVASDPCVAGASGRCAHQVSPSAKEIRASAYAAGYSAGRCASSAASPFRKRPNRKAVAEKKAEVNSAH